MQLSTILASAVSLAAAASAGTIGVRQGTDNPRLAQFRFWSDFGCDKLNQGYYTIDADAANKCHQLSTDPPALSVMLQSLTRDAEGCEFNVYSSNDCTGETYGPNPLNSCRNAQGVPTQAGQDKPTFGSYKLVCPNKF